MSRRHGYVGLAVSVCALCSLGCEKVVEHPENLEEQHRARYAAVKEPALEVDGAAVGGEQFRWFWEARPDLSREEAIEAWTTHELVARRAFEEGYADREEVSLARKRAMVAALLAETVEREVDEASLSAAAVEAREEALRAEVGRPVGLRASHLLVRVPEEEDEERREALFAQARSKLDAVRAGLGDEVDAYDLDVAREGAQQDIEAPFEVVVNPHLLFPVEQVSGQRLPEGWIEVVPAFRDAALSMARRGGLGQLSGPVRTPFGWHVLVVHELLPGARPDEAALAEVARADVLEVERREAFEEAYSRWTMEADVSSYPLVIEEADELN